MGSRTGCNIVSTCVFCLLPAQLLGSTILLTAVNLYLLTVGIYLRHVLVRGTNVRFDRIQLVHQMTFNIICLFYISSN